MDFLNVFFFPVFPFFGTYVPSYKISSIGTGPLGCHGHSTHTTIIIIFENNMYIGIVEISITYFGKCSLTPNTYIDTPFK